MKNSLIRNGIPLFVAAMLGSGLYGCRDSIKLDEARNRVQSQVVFRNASKAFEVGDFAEAQALLTESLKLNQKNANALLLLGHVLRQSNQPQEAVKAYQDLAGSDSDEEQRLLALCFEADTQFYDLGDSAAAELAFRQVLARNSKHGMANQGLGMMLQIQGRVHEAPQFLIKAIRYGQLTVRNLVVLGWTQVPAENPDVLQKCLLAHPQDAFAMLGQGKVERYRNRNEEGVLLFRNAASITPNCAPIQGALGVALVESPQSEAFLLWKQGLPVGMEDHPAVAFALAKDALTHGRVEEAAILLKKCVYADPDHPQAVYQLGLLISEHGPPEYGKTFLDRAHKLERLGVVLGKIQDGGPDVSQEWLVEAAQLTSGLGRLAEADAWYQIALMLGDDEKLQHERRGVLLGLSADSEHFSRTSAQVVAGWPESLLLREVATPLPRPHSGWSREAALESHVQFDEASDEWGFEFSFDSGCRAPEEGVRMQEMMGGGVGVLDVDRDGWLDLWCTQAGLWEQRGGNVSDMLFRNYLGVRLTEVTEIASVLEPNFSQGVSVGDVDQDGFPDVYVANIGDNQLFVNNGDGTFSEGISVSVKNDKWTASCALVDLNGDTFPDIYDVNYVSGDTAFSRKCRGNGAEHNCRPALFQSSQDQVFRNNGQGGFLDETQTAGIVHAAGYGLGIVTGNFDDSPGLDLFVANDFSANYLFQNRSSTGGSLSFLEVGLTSGVAVDDSGRFQACMGVATLDLENDGISDIFVTNFSDESNTLYSQAARGLFLDQTKRSNLRNSGFDRVGFGAQSLDADNDGDEDLMFVNGALAPSLPTDSGAVGMPATLMLNHNGTFHEAPSDSSGEYFTQLNLGRGLTRGDFNSDGKCDAVVSNLDSPAALLINTTARSGTSIRLRLVARSADRTGVGSLVVVSDSTGQTTREVGAGDGYMASNEHAIIVGTGDRTEVQVKVIWPSGAVQEFPSVPTNSNLIIVEGGALLPIPR